MIQASRIRWPSTQASRPARNLGSKRNTHFLMKFVHIGYSLLLHFEKRHQEGKRRFSSLIFIHTVGMESVSTSTRSSVVQWNLQVVLAKVPAEDMLRLFEPTPVARQSVGFEAGGYCGASFDGLLVEAGLLFTLSEKPVGADGYKGLFVTAMLGGDKPFERFNSSGDHFLVSTTPSGEDERLRQPGI